MRCPVCVPLVGWRTVEETAALRQQYSNRTGTIYGAEWYTEQPEYQGLSQQRIREGSTQRISTTCSVLPRLDVHVLYVFYSDTEAQDHWRRRARQPLDLHATVYSYCFRIGRPSSYSPFPAPFRSTSVASRPSSGTRPQEQPDAGS